MSYVIAENLSKSFGQNHVFSNIQFTIEKVNSSPYSGPVAAENRHYYAVLQDSNNRIMVSCILIVKI